MRIDLHFLVCCCKSFIGKVDDEYYTILQLDRDASPDDIKRAYKRLSLQMHPDKLAQRGQTVTAESQAAFTKMKQAYEILSDPRKRETYNAVGVTGLQWMEEPFSIDPQELAHNFAASSVADRSKVFAIFVAIAVAVLLQPILVCLMVDGRFGSRDAADDDDDRQGGGASWCAVLAPFWMWNVVVLLYHVRVIQMGPVQRPDHVPVDQWIDPLPMGKRYMSLGRFLLLALCSVMVALRLDHVLTMPWTLVMLPYFLWEASNLYTQLPLARMRIVTVQDLEATLGKPFSEFTQTEKELIGNRYSVVSSLESPDFDVAQRLKLRARRQIALAVSRLLFVLLVACQVDSGLASNWWLVLMPFWIWVVCECYTSYHNFLQVQKAAMEKDPQLFSPPQATQYGAVEDDGTPLSTLTPEEREKLKAQLSASSSKLCSKCCSQGFLLIIVLLSVGKLQGAGFSAIWVISPVLFVVGVVLICIGCAIFGVKEVPVDMNAADFAYMNAEAGKSSVPDATPGEAPDTTASSYVPPPSVTPPESTSTETDVIDSLGDTEHVAPSEDRGDKINELD